MERTVDQEHKPHGFGRVNGSKDIVHGYLLACWMGSQFLCVKSEPHFVCVEVMVGQIESWNATR